MFSEMSVMQANLLNKTRETIAIVLLLKEKGIISNEEIAAKIRGVKNSDKPTTPEECVQSIGGRITESNSGHDGSDISKTTSTGDSGICEADGPGSDDTSN